MSPATARVITEAVAALLLGVAIVALVMALPDALPGGTP